MGNNHSEVLELTQSSETPVYVKIATKDEMKQKLEAELPWQPCKVKLFGRSMTLHSSEFAEFTWNIDERLEIVAENLPEHVVGFRWTGETVVFLKMKFETVHVICQWLGDFQRAKRPVWDPDAIASCKRCARRFSFFKRIHHCRNCGSAVCAPCSRFQATLPHMGYSNSQRVCIDCSHMLKDLIVTELKRRMATSLIVKSNSDQSLKRGNSEEIPRNRDSL